MKNLKMIFCCHEYEYIRTLYGDEINAHNGRRKEYRCVKCGIYKFKEHDKEVMLCRNMSKLMSG